MIRTLNFEQGTEEWFAARRGVITASVIGRLITTKTLQPASNNESRALVLQLAAERITEYTEPTYPTRDMERGTFDEPVARAAYAEAYGAVTAVGFMTNNGHGPLIGYSPDGLVEADGLIEIKSRNQRAQLATILADEVPPENMAQCQTGLLVSDRSWIDYVSYCGGMPLYTKRIYPDLDWFGAIVTAARKAEAEIEDIITRYDTAIVGLPATERGIDLYEEMRLPSGSF